VHRLFKLATGGLLVAIAALPAITGTAFAGNGTPIDTGSAETLTLAVYGDAPYGTTATDTAELQATPAFIDSINGDPQVDLVAHVGDIHSGKQYCTQAYDQSVFDLWSRFKDPLVYTPGDNEWTDCHKAGEGGNVLDADGNPVDFANGNPVANLDLVRAIFFAQHGTTLGGRKKQVLSQAQAFDPAHPTDADYVENVLWEQSKTLFVTVNIPGGSNNDADNWYGAPRAQQQTDEIAQRTGADLRWIDVAFALAKAGGVESVVVIQQGDMWDLDGKAPSHIANFEPFIQHIADGATSFGRPVLLLEGDSHTYRSDNPFVSRAPCTTESGDATVACANDAWANHAGMDLNVPNVHRVVVHGSTFPLEWLKLTIDPRASHPTSATSFGPFSWTRQIQH
jgi:hypothetical protein